MLTDRPGVEVEEIVKTIVFASEYCTVVQVTTSPHDGTCLVC